ncbi:unnamed protein product, partial [Phaeothamnion confervicola]
SSSSSSSSATAAARAATAEYGIVDGQHRIGALMIMSEEGAWDRASENVLVDVFSTTQEQDIADLFTEINKAEPVRLVDMPGEGAGEHVKAILHEAVAELEAKYPEMFKPSMRCRPPHLNPDRCRDEVFQSELITRHGLKTTAQLVGWLLCANEALGRDKWSSPGGRAASAPGDKTLDRALQKAHANQFFLGLDKSWLHN